MVRTRNRVRGRKRARKVLDRTKEDNKLIISILFYSAGLVNPEGVNKETRNRSTIPGYEDQTEHHLHVLPFHSYGMNNNKDILHFIVLILLITNY
jgi:hypothetical protein